MPKAKIEFLQASWLDIDRISDFYLREVGPVSAEKAIDEIMEHILWRIVRSIPFVFIL